MRYLGMILLGGLLLSFAGVSRGEAQSRGEEREANRTPSGRVVDINEVEGGVLVQLAVPGEPLVTCFRGDEGMELCSSGSIPFRRMGWRMMHSGAGLISISMLAWPVIALSAFCIFDCSTPRYAPPLYALTAAVGATGVALVTVGAVNQRRYRVKTRALMSDAYESRPSLTGAEVGFELSF